MNVASLELSEIELRPVKGLEDRFMVGADGTIHSLPSRTGRGRIRKQWQDKLGYCYVSYKIDGVVKKIIVHRAVAQAFLEPAKGKNIVNHKDGNTSHNHPHNLEWVTVKGNVADSIKRGTFVYFGREKNNVHG